MIGHGKRAVDRVGRFQYSIRHDPSHRRRFSFASSCHKRVTSQSKSEGAGLLRTGGRGRRANQPTKQKEPKKDRKRNAIRNEKKHTNNETVSRTIDKLKLDGTRGFREPNKKTTTICGRCAFVAEIIKLFAQSAAFSLLFFFRDAVD